MLTVAHETLTPAGRWERHGNRSKPHSARTPDEASLIHFPKDVRIGGRAMNLILRKIPIGVSASAVLSGIAIAQSTAEVNVQATRTLTVESGGRTTSGIPIKDVTLSYGVVLDGLNLATSSGATEAARRISEAAKAACEEIGRQYPNATPSDKECAKAATDEGMTRLHELIAGIEMAAGK